MKRLFSYGVDGIFTDDPVRAREELVNHPSILQNE